MEEQTNVTRTSRSREENFQLVAHQLESGLSVKQFCRTRGISESSFHYWKGLYMKKGGPAVKSSFARIDLTAGFPALFAQVGDIKIYQPVSADYLKQLSL